MSARRDRYADVGRAMRESIERALAADLAGRDWKVLVAIWHRLATWSRLADRIYTAELCTLSGLKPNKVRESVAKLVEAGTASSSIPMEARSSTPSP